MGILKTLNVSSKREANGTYSVLLSKIPTNQQSSLLFEAGVVCVLDSEESTQLRKRNTYTKLIDGYACLGILQLAYGESKSISFLVIVTGCVSVGRIQHSEIYRVTDTAFLSLRNNAADSQLIQGVKKLLNSGAFYFSHTTNDKLQPIDLTLSCQRSRFTSTTDNQFFWNKVMFRYFERHSLDTGQWLAKILCGGVCISTVYIGSQQARACIISRLSCERAGTRFNVRGVNDHGHVANFVETEQIILMGQQILSFVIIRGSIPLFWEQPGVQVGSHRIKMSRGSEISQPAYDKHMLLLRERFTNFVIVNLLGCKESEQTINQLFNAHHGASNVASDVPLINFDYHSQCPRGRLDQLEALYESQLASICDNHGFYHQVNNDVQQWQKGVFRVNCLDCLDRTNSFQTFIGLKMLERLVGSLNNQDLGKTLPRFRDVFEIAWAQNGDQISRIYTGTGALEGKNLLKDGTLSVARTIQNNLLDQTKQSAIDILIFGKPLNRDYAYRVASLLPCNHMLAPPNILISMCDRYLEFCDVKRLKIAVATWNVNGGRHFDNVFYRKSGFISDWLVDYRQSVGGKSDGRPVDIYAIGFQEIVDLNASNIVASSTQNQRDWLIEIQKTIGRDQPYLLVTSVQLVGVCLIVFVREKLAPHIKDVCFDQVKTGLGGATGNKGGVAIRLRYRATSLCFVCAHFAAGQSQTKERNEDYAEITRRLQFPMGRSINSHDYVFWCGDFNYRLDNISNENARRAVWKSDWQTLLECDQLRLSQKEGLTFKDYVEGDIQFAPTYKYDLNSDDYDTSEKCRVPAWTDRVLFKKRHPTHAGEQLTDPKQILFYNRIELRSSDHRPVIAEFVIEVLEVNKTLRNQVFENVLATIGPPDATVLVKIANEQQHQTAVDNNQDDIGNQAIVANILKYLADEVGEVVLARFVHDQLRVTFRDGQTALKAVALDHTAMPGTNLKLSIRLNTSNWMQLVRNELTTVIDNTVNFIDGHRPSFNLDDDEDETAQQLNMSLGPSVAPDSLCLDHDIFHTSIDETTGQTIELSCVRAALRVASDSPSSSPTPTRIARPPPRQDPPVLPPSATATGRPPSRPPPPRPATIASTGLYHNAAMDSSDLINFSISSIEDTDCPPPSMPPPSLPPPPPPQVAQEDSPVLTSKAAIPVRSVPPPPIPKRSNLD